MLRSFNDALSPRPIQAPTGTHELATHFDTEAMPSQTAEQVIPLAMLASKNSSLSLLNSQLATRPLSSATPQDAIAAPIRLDDRSPLFDKSNATEEFASLAASDIPQRLPLRQVDLSLTYHYPNGLPVPIAPPPPSVTSKIGVHWERLALLETGSIGLALFGFRKFDEYFGSASRPFRVGNDWTKDRTLHFDELLHFQGSYRITQGLVSLYHWSGLKSPWAECLGAGTAATVMTFLEYVDGRRPKPKDKASYSDFLANFLGVGFALAKERVNILQDFDLQLSYRTPGDIFQKHHLLQYDRMTHWLTYNLKRKVRVPLHLGFGYGIRNAFKTTVQSELYLGIGFTPVDILELYSPTAAKPLAWLSMYHLGWQVQIK